MYNLSPPTKDGMGTTKRLQSLKIFALFVSLYTLLIIGENQVKAQQTIPNADTTLTATRTFGIGFKGNVSGVVT